MQRLKTRPQFQAVLAGSIIAKTGHFALHCIPLIARAPETGVGLMPKDRPEVCFEAPALFPVQDTGVGAMVPKRWARRAVTRNAIKRQIYTVSTDFLHHFPASAFLVRLRREFSRQEFASASSVRLKEAVRAELLTLLQAAVASKARTPFCV